MSTAVASSPPPPRPVVVGAAAGPNTDPWSEIVRLEYGADRSFAWSVREQVLHSAPESREGLEKKLLAALSTPGCTDAGRSALCELLALIGTSKGVPALATLLTEARSTEAARYALDRIPGPEASAALRSALPRLLARVLLIPANLGVHCADEGRYAEAEDGATGGADAPDRAGS